MSSLGSQLARSTVAGRASGNGGPIALSGDRAGKYPCGVALGGSVGTCGGFTVVSWGAGYSGASYFFGPEGLMGIDTISDVPTPPTKYGVIPTCSPWAPATGRCLQKNVPDVCPSGTSFEYRCDDGADCPSQTVCCGGFKNSVETQLVGAACLPLVDCKKSPWWVVLCDPNAVDPCPGGAACDVPDGGGQGSCTAL